VSIEELIERSSLGTPGARALRARGKAMRGVMLCSCGGRAGFTQVNGWWVCATCRLPTLGYLSAMVGQGTDGENVGLIYFKGGTLDGKAYETKDLLGRESLDLPITEYKWTSEKITSASDPTKTAQVWKHVSLSAGGSGPIPSTEDNNHSTASAESVDAVPVAPPVRPEDPDPGVPDVRFTMEDGTASATIAPASEAERAAADQLTQETEELGLYDQPQEGQQEFPELPTGESLLARRKALKASRGDLVDRTGLAFSKIANIEQGTGKRVKDEEVRKLADALTQMEQERGGAGARS
jgi:hypothetical protein